jgi:hypothetical protein
MISITSGEFAIATKVRRHPSYRAPALANMASSVLDPGHALAIFHGHFDVAPRSGERELNPAAALP